MAAAAERAALRLPLLAAVHSVRGLALEARGDAPAGLQVLGCAAVLC